MNTLIIYAAIRLQKESNQYFIDIDTMSWFKRNSETKVIQQEVTEKRYCKHNALIRIAGFNLVECSPQEGDTQ
jgi:hypothetical protein